MGIGSPQVGLPEPEPVGRPRREVLQEDVSRLGEAPDNGSALWLAKVHREVSLPCVHGHEASRESVHDAVPAADHIADPRALDLDDIGPQFRQDERAEGHGHRLFQSHHAQALQRTAHGTGPSSTTGKMSMEGAAARVHTITLRRYRITSCPAWL